MRRTCVLLLSAALAVFLCWTVPALAGTIIDDWMNVKAPPAPVLKSVTVDPKTTALLVMDFVKQTCNSDRRPRCLATVPQVAKLVAAARASGTMVVYTTPANVSVTDTLPAVAPKVDEPAVSGGVDKFTLGGNDTGLSKILKDKGIASVITVGTAVHGAVLYTASGAATRGFNVIVPVDGMSGDGQLLYDEQAVAYILTHAPVVSAKVTLTSIDLIKF